MRADSIRTGSAFKGPVARIAILRARRKVERPIVIARRGLGLR